MPGTLGRLLEAGCGAGVLGQRLKHAGKATYVCGIELNRHAGELARARLDRILIGDLETLPLGELHSRFDSAICADVLEHLRDPWEALAKLRQCLRDGGEVFASIPNIGYYKIVRRIMRDEWRYEPDGILDRTHLRFFTLSTIREMFALAGFEITQIVREAKHTRWSRLLARFSVKVEEFVTIQYYIRARKLPDKTATTR